MKGGDPEGWGQLVGPEGCGPKVVVPKGGGHKISRFFSLSHPRVRSWFSSLGVFSWNVRRRLMLRALKHARLEFSRPSQCVWAVTEEECMDVAVHLGLFSGRSHCSF